MFLNFIDWSTQTKMEPFRIHFISEFELPSSLIFFPNNAQEKKKREEGYKHMFLKLTAEVCISDRTLHKSQVNVPTKLQNYATTKKMHFFPFISSRNRLRGFTAFHTYIRLRTWVHVMLELSKLQFARHATRFLASPLLSVASVKWDNFEKEKGKKTYVR